MGKPTRCALRPRKTLIKSRWHTDVKPDNILYVEERLNVNGTADGDNQPKSANEEKAFKLADPGFAKFIPKPQHNSQAIPKQVLEGGTETYGAYSASSDQ